MKYLQLILILSLLLNCKSVSSNKGESKALLDAVKKENLIKTLQLINENYDVNQKGKSGYAPLHLASKLGKIEIVELLIKYKARVNDLDAHGWSPLHYAVFNGHIEVVKILLDDKANIEAKTLKGVQASGFVQGDFSSSTPLELAIANKQSNTAVYLIEKGADINIEAGTFNYPLLHDTVAYRLPEVAKLLIKKGYDINRRANDTTTALHLAAYEGRIKMLKLLIELGADLNIQINEDSLLSYGKGFTPLHSALRNDTGWGGPPNKYQVEAAKVLIQSGCDVNIKSSHDETALHFACMSQNIDVVKLLLKHKANVNDQDDEGRTALFYSFFDNSNEDKDKNCRKLIPILLNHKADPNIQDKVGNYAFHFGITSVLDNSSSETMIKLLERGLDINAKNREGLQLIHFAVNRFNLKLLKYLIKNGSDINTVAKYFENSGTPLHFCAILHSESKKWEKICLEMAKILIDNKADPHIKNLKGKSPLELAKKKKMIDLLKSNLKKIN